MEEKEENQTQSINLVDTVLGEHQEVQTVDQPVTKEESKQEITTEIKPKFVPDQSKSYSEQAKDIVGVIATEKAINDSELQEKVTSNKKDELIANSEASKKTEQAASKTAEKALNAANYGIYEGVAKYAGIEKPLPKVMQNILFFVLGIIEGIILVIVGIPTSIINILADCIDSIFKKLVSITKSARIVVISIFIIAVIVLITIIGFLHFNKYILHN